MIQFTSNDECLVLAHKKGGPLNSPRYEGLVSQFKVRMLDFEHKCSL